MIIPIGHTIVLRDENFLTDQWGTEIYFVHRFAPDAYLLQDEYGVRVYYATEQENWGDAYYLLLDESVYSNERSDSTADPNELAAQS